MSDLKICYYGDDFTGSTDALECLVLAGMKSMLFIDPPTPAQLANYPGLQAVGVAGCTRALSPHSLEKKLRPALYSLRALGAPHVHYKVCSTFDSSPELGSIGRVMELAREYFHAPFIPIVAGTPALGRYCIFGNLFAQLGTNNPREVYRLDKHPVMSKHPSTPMCDAEIVKHLSRQTKIPLSIMNVIDLDQPLQVARRILHANYSSGYQGIVFDSMHEGHLNRVGELLDPFGTPENPLFTVGSSAVESAFAGRWQTTTEVSTGFLDRPSDVIKSNTATRPMLIGSGSCSVVTIQQIREAIKNGFADVLINPAKIWDINTREQEIGRVISLSSRAIGEGKNVILHTTKQVYDPIKSGIDDELIVSGNNLISTEESSRVLGTTLGEIMLNLICQFDLKRICLSGGDTSGYVARVLGIEAVEMLAPLVRGAPICRVMSNHPGIDRLEIVFKGGQVGPKEFFMNYLNHTYQIPNRLEYV